MTSSDASKMVATREEMKRAKLDVAYRDFCAHLLIPLNECRRKSFYLPWKCEHERHVYEKCQYKECVARRNESDVSFSRWCASMDACERGRRGRSSSDRFGVGFDDDEWMFDLSTRARARWGFECV